MLRLSANKFDTDQRIITVLLEVLEDTSVGVNHLQRAGFRPGIINSLKVLTKWSLFPSLLVSLR